MYIAPALLGVYYSSVGGCIWNCFTVLCWFHLYGQLLCAGWRFLVRSFLSPGRSVMVTPLCGVMYACMWVYFIASFPSLLCSLLVVGLIFRCTGVGCASKKFFKGCYINVCVILCIYVCTCVCVHVRACVCFTFVCPCVSEQLCKTIQRPLKHSV